MADKREQILTRLHTVLNGIPGVELVLRNDIEVPEGKLPALVLLDGDEEVDSEHHARARGPRGPLIVTMFPEVYLITMDEPETVGANLTAFRTAIINAVATDETLLALLKDGDARYNGMQTGLALGRSIAGEAGLQFALTYVLYPGAA